MSQDKREVVKLEKRATITNEDLDKAFVASEEVFWQKALEFFPEVQSGDTDPMATGIYNDTVKAFMKHWLDVNAHIMLDGLTEADADALAETVVEDSFNYAGDDGDYLIATEGSGDPMKVKVVELQHNGNPQGYAIQVSDVIGQTTEIARNEFDLEVAIEAATKAITERIDK